MVKSNTYGYNIGVTRFGRWRVTYGETAHIRAEETKGSGFSTD